jgi:hypothetical protein
LRERGWRDTRTSSSKCVWMGYRLTGAEPF